VRLPCPFKKTTCPALASWPAPTDQRAFAPAITLAAERTDGSLIRVVYQTLRQVRENVCRESAQDRTNSDPQGSSLVKVTDMRQQRYWGYHQIEQLLAVIESKPKMRTNHTDTRNLHSHTCLDITLTTLQVQERHFSATRIFLPNRIFPFCSRGRPRIALVSRIGLAPNSTGSRSCNLLVAMMPRQSGLPDCRGSYALE